MSRIFLSPPHMGGDESLYVEDAFQSNWIAPLGPYVDLFEAKMAERLGSPWNAVALSSGTAALHLALILLGVGVGDEVLVPTLTFAATANAVTYVGAQPVFVDVDPDTWQMDPDLVADELHRSVQRGRPIAAVVTVDLYGQCADHDPIAEVAAKYGIPVIEDAAEALGATYKGRPAGTLGDLGVLSFNGNKTITTSGGGMLLTPSEALASRARHLATQAREPAAHYEHNEIGYNYRLSNLLAAVGAGQMNVLDQRVARRRDNNAYYRHQLAGISGIGFMPDANYGEGTWWLTCVTLDPVVTGKIPADVIGRLESADIEARPVWKPMHLQPVFQNHRSIQGDVAAGIFATGLCLPSGSSLSDEDRERVAHTLIEALN